MLKYKQKTLVLIYCQLSAHRVINSQTWKFAWIIITYILYLITHNSTSKINKYKVTRIVINVIFDNNSNLKNIRLRPNSN
jgi:hypothetical protein